MLATEKKQNKTHLNHVNLSLDRIIAFKLAYPGQKYLFEIVFLFGRELPEYLTVKEVTVLQYVAFEVNK